MGERKIILVLSGEICTGKSKLADQLKSQYGFLHCKTRDGLSYYADEKLKGSAPQRDFYQKLGEELDVAGGGEMGVRLFSIFIC